MIMMMMMMMTMVMIQRSPPAIGRGRGITGDDPIVQTDKHKHKYNIFPIYFFISSFL